MSTVDGVTISISWCKERGESLPLPNYETEGAAGMDIRAAVDVEIAPQERVAIPTGLKVAIPVGFELQVRARSGLALRKGLSMANGVGTIDCDFRGEVHVLVVNLGSEAVKVARGERIAQFVLQRVPRVEWRPVSEEQLSQTPRGTGGFGSTG